jgi:hypothetical protein
MGTTKARWCSSRFVPMAVGLLLLVAAGLKVLYPAKLSSELHNQWFTTVVVGLELLIGIWLVSGLLAAWARLTALGLFLGFAVFNLSQTLEGRVSCACFGDFALKARETLAVDLIGIVSLIAWRPPAIRFSLGLAVVIVPLVAMSACISAVWVSRVPSRDDYPIEVTPNPLSLGTLHRGKYARNSFVIRNRSSEPVDLDHLETSCECVQVILPTHSLAPGQEMLGELEVNLAQKPMFTGSLAVDVVASMPNGEILFRLLVEAEVRQ